MAGNRLTDERLASWKVLLPAGSRKRVLVLECDDRITFSLGREFDHVETHFSGAGNYDLVVLNCSVMNHSGLRGCVSSLDPGTVVVCLNANSQDIQILNSKGFNSVRCYAGLPVVEPRIYIPINTKLHRTKGLTFHHPGSRRARFGIWGLRTLSWLGIKKPFMGNTVSICTSAENFYSSKTLAHWLSAKLGYEISDLVVYAGSELEKRKITALAIAENREADVVVKIAENEGGAAAIDQESTALRCLHSSPLSDQIPEILFEDRWHGYVVQGQRAFSGKTHSQMSRLSSAHYSFLRDLSKVDRQWTAFGGTSFSRRLEQKIGRIPLDDLLASVAQTWHEIIKSDVANRKVVCHRTHGDFAPWNMRRDKNRLFVYDWEESLPDGLAATDAFNFVFRQADLIGPWPGNTAMINTLREVGTRCLSAIGNIDKNDRDFYLLAWLMNEYAESRTERLAGLIELAALPCRG